MNEVDGKRAFSRMRVIVLILIMSLSGCFDDNSRAQQQSDGERFAQQAINTYINALKRAVDQFASSDAQAGDAADAVLGMCEAEFQRMESSKRNYYITTMRNPDEESINYANSLADRQIEQDRVNYRNVAIAAIIQRRQAAAAAKATAGTQPERSRNLVVHEDGSPTSADQQESIPINTDPDGKPLKEAVPESPIQRQSYKLPAPSTLQPSTDVSAPTQPDAATISPAASEVSVAPATPAPSSHAAPPETSLERLHRLMDLHAKGLMSEDEFAQSRDEIIKQLKDQNAHAGE
jgi:hypothetical protein